MKLPPSDQKLRGGYYTPPAVANFLTAWAIRSPNDRILEPASGGGVFLETALKRTAELGWSKPADALRLTAVEIDGEAANESRRILQQVDLADRVRQEDFFSFAESLPPSERWDVVLGNPPFLRFQYFQEDHRMAAFRLMERQGLRPNRLTNAWVPFVAVSASLLSENGRLAMVVPAELLQVSYAAELRRYLSESFDRVTLFTFERLLFDGVEQEVVLLLAERRSSRPGIRVVELESADDLRSQAVDTIVSPLKQMDHGTEKWTQYFLAPNELELLRSLRNHPRLARLDEFADVDVGVVTGMNDYFVLPARGTTADPIKEHLVPIVTRSAHLQGASFTRQDWRRLDAEGNARLLLLVREGEGLDEGLRSYLETGVKMGIPEGYKCRVRKIWYVVPSVYRPDGFMLRQIHRYPKIALNETQATSTDTVHRVSFHAKVDRKAIVAAFYNSATFLFSEVYGRSYGGGVLELEPSEADALLVPRGGNGADLFSKVDVLLRADNVAAALRLVNSKVLTPQLDLSRAELATLTTSWEKLRDRRLGRKSRVRQVRQQLAWA